MLITILMANIIVTTVGVEQHVYTFVPIVSDLVNRGHKILWISTKKYQKNIQNTGASFVDIPEHQDLAGKGLKEITKKNNPKKYPCILKTRKKVLKDFFDYSQPIINLLETVHTFFTPDVYISDPQSYGTFLTAEKHEKPSLIIHISPFFLRAANRINFCNQTTYLKGFLGRFADRALDYLFEKLIMNNVMIHVNNLRQRNGLDAFKEVQSNIYSFSKEILITSISSLNKVKPAIPSNIHFVGPLLESYKSNFKKPDWWHELDECRPVILINQVSIIQDPSEVIFPLVNAMKDEYVLFVVYPVVKKIEGLPANVRTISSVPLANILPKTDLLITNGSYDTTHMALAYGVPMVITDSFKENNNIAAPVYHSGAAIHLKNKAHTGKHLKNTVLEILQDRKFKIRAECLKNDIKQTNPVQNIGDIIENHIPKQTVSKSKSEHQPLEINTF